MIKIFFLNLILFGFCMNADKPNKEDGLDLLSVKSKSDFPQLWVPDVSIQVSTSLQKATESIKKIAEGKSEGEGLCEHEINPLIKAACLREQRKKTMAEKCIYPYEECIKGDSLQQCEEFRRACLRDFREVHSQEVRKLLKPYQTGCSPSNPDYCYKRFLDLKVMIPLKIRRHNTDGKFITEELSKGKYDVNVQLVSHSYTDIDVFYRMHEETDDTNKKACHKTLGFHEDDGRQNKYLSLQCTLKIPYFKGNAGYKLLMDLRPAEDSSLPFKAFQGIYTLNRKFIKNSEVYSLSVDPDIDAYYKETLNTEKEINIFQGMDIKDIIASQEVDYSGFNIPRLEDDGKGTYKYANIHTPKDCRQRDNGVTRTVVFSGDVCFNDILTGEKYPHTIFRVFIEKPDENGEYFIEEVFPIDPDRPFYKTKGNGCMEELTISLSHKIYVRQRYVRVKIHFLSEELNIYARAEPALNPWQKQFQAYMDATEISDNDKIRFNVSGVVSPKLIINGFKSVRMLPYDLDKSLNHRLYFLFQPFIQRLGDATHGTFEELKELMGNGYYLVRLLLLRNPQETLHTNRAYLLDQIDERRRALQNKNIDFEEYKNAEYITHTDSIVKAESDSANLYVSFDLTTEQLHSSSRNMISVEIVPADPSKLVYHEVKEDGECRLNMEATRWSPYFDHELINNAFIGTFNPENLSNWHILRPIPGFSSDKIIDESEIGKKYKYFDLRKPL